MSGTLPLARCCALERASNFSEKMTPGRLQVSNDSPTVAQTNPGRFKTKKYEFTYCF